MPIYHIQVLTYTWLLYQQRIQPKMLDINKILKLSRSFSYTNRNKFKTACELSTLSSGINHMNHQGYNKKIKIRISKLYLFIILTRTWHCYCSINVNLHLGIDGMINQKLIIGMEFTVTVFFFYEKVNKETIIFLKTCLYLLCKLTHGQHE